MRRAHLVERAAALLAGGPTLAGPAVPEPARAETPPGPPAAPPAAAAVAAPDAVPAVAATVLATVLATEVMERAGLVDGSRRTRVAEEFNITAGNLLRAVRAAREPGASAQGGLANLLMVTSAKPDEGKSFSALNLAASLARNGLARVILADIDPKLGSLTTQLGLDGLPGLLDIAADPALPCEPMLVATAIRDLSVVPLGTRDTAPGDRRIPSRLAAAVERLARRFAASLIVLDAPPCLATSEPAALAPSVRVVAVVVEAERTQREELEQSLEMLKPCPNVLLLLNKVRGAAGTAFGDYDYYGA